jgi:uncharacterized protein YehS (DUF1456 family)
MHVPYLVYAMEAALILAQAGASDSLIAAALEKRRAERYERCGDDLLRYLF